MACSPGSALSGELPRGARTLKSRSFPSPPRSTDAGSLQASLYGLELQVGGYVMLEGGGTAHLGRSSASNSAS